MATVSRGAGMVGYNVQTAVDAKHHLIVAHEVTNAGHDRDQLANMAKLTKAAPRVNVNDIRRPTRIGVGADLMPCLQGGNEPSRREAWHQCQQ